MHDYKIPTARREFCRAIHPPLRALELATEGAAMPI
jgi:hypothetical protein